MQSCCYKGTWKQSQIRLECCCVYQYSLRFKIKQCHTWWLQAFMADIIRWCLLSQDTIKDCGLKRTLQMMWCFHLLSFLQNIILNPQFYTVSQPNILSFYQYHSVTALTFEHHAIKMPYVREHSKSTLISTFGLVLWGYREPIFLPPRLTDINSLGFFL